MNLFTTSTAEISACGTYRYTLTRTWNHEAAPLVFVMLNPSTADANQNDPTVERCQRRAEKSGYGGLIVLNIFALRSTDPGLLYSHPDPVGPENDGRVWSVLSPESKTTPFKREPTVICGWGEHGALNGRGKQVLKLLTDMDIRPFCLAVNKSGCPKHPLYCGYNLEPIPYGVA